MVRQVPAGHRLARQARFLASVSLLELKRYQEAFDDLTRLNGEESDATLLNNLGVVQLRRAGRIGTGARAVSYFNEAASLDGVDSFFNLGYAYWLDGDASAAVLVASGSGATQSGRSRRPFRAWRRAWRGWKRG